MYVGSKHFIVLMARTSVLALLSTAAAAQSTASQTSASPTDSQAATAPASEATGDIVVTARKRNETLLQVPISISAFSGEQLQRAGVNSVSDIQNSVPSLQYSPRSDLENQISIRGVGGDPRNIGTESGVSLYIDGVYAGRTAGYNQDLANISQVEVLRGPQGTLFGKNTTGGVINVITDKPGDQFKGQLQGSYGNYNAVILKGTVSGPITSNLFAGLTLATTQRDGYVLNVFNGRKLDNIDRRGGRLQLVWQSPAGLNFYWTADHTTNESDFAITQLAGPYAGNGAPFAALNTRLQTSQDQNNHDNLMTEGVSQTVDYTFGEGPTLTAVSAYRKTNILVNSDSDALPIDTVHSGPFTDDSHFFSQEVRLSSPDRGLIRYVVGGYYFHQTATSLRIINGTATAAGGYVVNARVLTDSFAGFGNVDIHPTDQITVTGGIRYTSEKKTADFVQQYLGANYNYQGLHRRDNDVSWTASVNYRPTLALSFYATASRGFKSGGFNVDQISTPNAPASALTFQPEKLMNYEVGAKGRLFHGLFTYSADVFYDKLDNKQVTQFLGAAVPFVLVNNAGKARIKGFEVEASLHPSPLLTISGSVSRLDTRYLSYPNATPAGVSYTGNRLENAPAWSADGTIDARAPISFGYITARGTVRYTGDTYFQPDNRVDNLQKGYTLFSGRLGVETASGRTELAVFGKNLTDKGYYVFSRFNGTNHQVLYGEPRTYGVELTQKF